MSSFAPTTTRRSTGSSRPGWARRCCRGSASIAAIPGVRAVEIDIGLPPRVIGLAWHRDRDLLPAAREFVATTERVCAELADEQPVASH